MSAGQRRLRRRQTHPVALTVPPNASLQLLKPKLLHQLNGEQGGVDGGGRWNTADLHWVHRDACQSTPAAAVDRLHNGAHNAAKSVVSGRGGTCLGQPAGTAAAAATAAVAVSGCRATAMPGRSALQQCLHSRHLRRPAGGLQRRLRWRAGDQHRDIRCPTPLPCVVLILLPQLPVLEAAPAAAGIPFPPTVSCFTLVVVSRRVLRSQLVWPGSPGLWRLRVVELPARIGIDHVAQTHIAISCSGFHLRVCGSDRNKREGKWCRNEEEMRPHAGPEGIDDGGPATIPYREAYLPVPSSALIAAQASI